jgi:hypothetical protein
MGTLAVLALVGRMVVLFALLMLVPLAFAWGQHDAAESAFLRAIGITLAVRPGHEPGHAPLPARTATARWLLARDADLDAAAGIRRLAADAGDR